ncbi:MAG TPA: hypothetical protein VM100_10915, partial [Longimicrobiales bacterium]|nr:hypothetical protein [Longimicrobiales bacterium]
GLIELRSEFVHDSWSVPRVNENAIDNSFYVEGKVKVAAGAFIAGRYSTIRFNELTYTRGGTTPWDYDVDRIQLGAAYRVLAPLEIRGEYMFNHMHSPIDPRDNLLSLQVSWQLNN